MRLIESIANDMRMEDAGSDFEGNELDRQYFAALKRGDEETAEKIVRAAAAEKMAGTKVVAEDGLPLLVYHASRWNPLEEEDGNAIFNVTGGNSPGVWFTPNPYQAQTFYEDGLVGDYFLFMKTPRIIDARGASFEGIPSGFDVEILGPNGDNILDLSNGKWRNHHFLARKDAERYARKILKRVRDGIAAHPELWGDFMVSSKVEIGCVPIDDAVLDSEEGDFDGTIIKNCHDGHHGMGDYYVVHGNRTHLMGVDYNHVSSQIKSANLITRNGAGRVIPPSERFDMSNPDIRY